MSGSEFAPGRAEINDWRVLRILAGAGPHEPSVGLVVRRARSGVVAEPERGFGKRATAWWGRNEKGRGSLRALSKLRFAGGMGLGMAMDRVRVEAQFMVRSPNALSLVAEPGPVFVQLERDVRPRTLTPVRVGPSKRLVAVGNEAMHRGPQQLVPVHQVPVDRLKLHFQHTDEADILQLREAPLLVPARYLGKKAVP